MIVFSQRLCALLCFLFLVGSGIAAHADEFIGPLAGWTNLNTSYPKQSGDADDTKRMQRALDDLGTTGHAHVLYIPTGTYSISSTLKIKGRDGISILGADPATTIIKWSGTAAPDFNGAMIAVNGCWFSRYGRITWDGNNVAQTAWLDYWDGNLDPNNSTYFPTHNEHADEVFQNVGYGIRVGLNMPQDGHNYGDAETPVLRCKFLNCTIAGFCVQDFNALDWFLWYCTFDHCARGATNNPPTGGSGGFHVYNCVFRYSSVADVSISNTGYFSLRGNYSIHSHQFFNAAWQGANSAQVTLQKNTVLDTDMTSVEMSNAGPLMLIDNVIRSASGQSGPVVTVGVNTGQDDTVSLGNTFTVANHIATGPSAPGRIRLVADTANSDKTVNPGDINIPEPVLPGTLPNYNRRIYEVSATGGSAEIQSRIQAAITDEAQPGALARPVVHIPGGVHAVASTITIPAGSDVQLVGDGYGIFNATTLNWTGPAGGTVLSLASPSRATLRDFAVSGNGAATGIQTYVGDQVGDRVFMESSDVSDSTAAGLLYNGLGNTVAEMHDFYHSTSAGISVSVVGDNMGSGVGRVDMFGGDASSNTGLSYDVKSKGSLMVQDAWYEAHNLNGTVDPNFHAPRFMSLSGSGTFTLQGAHIAAVTEPNIPVISVGDFAGNVSFIGITLAPNYGSQTSSSPVTVQSAAGSTADVLALGMMGDSANWLTSASSSAQIAFLNDKLPAPSGGSMQYANQGRQDDAFLEQMLYQTRHEYPSAAPLAATSAGTSDVRFYRVRSSSGGGTAHTAYDIRIDKTPQVGQPDLVVTGISSTPATPVTGQATTFGCTVKNQGTAPTPANTILGVSWWVDGTQVNWEDVDVSALAVGASRSETATSGPAGSSNWAATTGTHILLAWVDDINRIAESDETNNKLTVSQTIAAGSTAPIGKTISLKSLSTNCFVSGYNGNATPMIADRTSVGGWEQFVVRDAGNGTVALQAGSGVYVTAASATSLLIANATSVAAAQTFQWVDQGAGKVALKAMIDSQFVAVNSNKNLVASGGSTPATASTFQWVAY